MTGVELLFVCTGNICRSPMGERLARAFAEEALGRNAGLLTAYSAGTEAVVGREMEANSAVVLSGLGGDPEGFRGRQFRPEMADRADLVLTLTRTHRRKVLKQAPRAMQKTFTLLEAADLLEDLPIGHLPVGRDIESRAAQLVPALARRRALRRGIDPETDDVPDPIRKPLEFHAEVGDLIAESLFPLLQEIVGIRDRSYLGQPVSFAS